MAVYRTHLVVVIISLLAYYINGDSIQLQAEPIHVNEDNWLDVLEGEWMVEFMAPWCPACRSFQQTWDNLAQKWNKNFEVHVAVVDVTENPGLSGRFLVTALPSIYHVKDGQFRFYVGPRSEVDLITFIDDKKWKDVQPVSKWISPDSIQMNMVGHFFKLAMNIRSFYTLLTEEYGLPEWGCYVVFAVITIIAGLILGMILVCICDCMIPQKQYSAPEGLMNAEMDKEGDLIDDTPAADGDVGDTNMDDGDTDDAPTDDAPTDDAPTDDAPTDDAPTDDAPTDDAPTDDAPTDDAPTDDAPTDDAPTDDAPTDDGDVGDADTDDGDTEVRHRHVQNADEKTFEGGDKEDNDNKDTDTSDVAEGNKENNDTDGTGGDTKKDK